jgi:hypothetical protein
MFRFPQEKSLRAEGGYPIQRISGSGARLQAHRRLFEGGVSDQAPNRSISGVREDTPRSFYLKGLWYCSVMMKRAT